MASITYGATTALADVGTLASLPDGQAYAFGKITAAGELTNMITIEVPILTAAAGTYDLYLVESWDGVTWTDNIDPAVASTDVAAYISDAQLLASSDATFVTTTRIFAEFSVPVAMLVHAKFIGFVLVNNSGQTPGGTSTGNQQTLTVA